MKARFGARMATAWLMTLPTIMGNFIERARARVILIARFGHVPSSKHHDVAPTNLAIQGSAADDAGSDATRVSQTGILSSREHARHPDGGRVGGGRFVKRRHRSDSDSSWRGGDD